MDDVKNLVLAETNATCIQSGDCVRVTYWWCGFLQAIQHCDDLGFLLDVDDFLYDVETGRTCSTNVDRDRFYQCTLGKVLNLLGHGGRKEKSLTLALQRMHHTFTCIYFELYFKTILFVLVKP